MEDSAKISLATVLPECSPWSGLKGRKCRNFACYRLLENAFIQNHITIRFENEMFLE